MKVAFIADRTHQAPVYHRVVQFLPPLAEAGIEARLIPIPPGTYNRLSLFRYLKSQDLVILQRKLFSFVHFIPFRLLVKRWAFDMDDALFLKDSRSHAYTSSTLQSRFRRTVRAADRIICGNEWLEERVAPLNPKVEVIPTVVDTETFGKPKDHTKSASFRAVWIGGRSTLFYLEKILPGLVPLKKEIEGFKLTMISDRFPDAPDSVLERVTWSRKTEISSLREGDVGLAPLEDDDWCRGKCGLKLLQYNAAGLPAIGSPVGVNKKIIDHEKSGFHVRTPDDWQNHLLSLARNPKMRSSMGREARLKVEEEYSLKAWKDRFVRLIRDLASPAP